MTGTDTGTSPNTHYLTVGEGRIAYDVHGEGPLVLLVPGMGELRSSYRHLTPLLLEAGYTVATTDLRGHGDSDATFSSYGDSATAEDITALLTHLAGPGQRGIIVGNSMAAGAAVIAAADHPDQVAGLVLVGPFVRNPPLNPAMKALFHLMTTPAWVARVWKAYMPTLYAGTKPADFDPYRAAAIASMSRPAHAKAFARTARQSDHAPAEEALARVSAPALVLMGERDPDFKDPRAEAQWIGQALHAEVVLVPDAGHYPHAQQPQLSAEAVLAFCGRVMPRG